MTWTDAFKGIPWYLSAGAEKYSDEDVPSVLERRLRNRLDTEAVRVPIATLFEIAKRIDGQSAEILRLANAGTVLDPAALAEYEAKQAEAERAAVKTGVLVEDPQGDWAALYNATGSCVTQDHLSNVRQTVIDGSWSVHKFSAEGFLFDWDAGEGVPGPDDYQEFPPTLAEFQRAYGARLQAEPRTPENPITGEPGAERDERSA